MRTMSVPWRVSTHERYRFRGWPSWLRLVCLISPVALAAALALVLASCQVEARGGSLDAHRHAVPRDR